VRESGGGGRGGEEKQGLILARKCIDTVLQMPVRRRDCKAVRRRCACSLDSISYRIDAVPQLKRKVGDLVRLQGQNRIPHSPLAPR